MEKTYKVDNPLTKLLNKVDVRAGTMLLVLGTMILISTLLSPVFLTFRNIMNILNQNSIYGIMALGMACVILCGCIDLSAGSIAALAGVISVEVFANHGLVAGLLVGITVGAIIGLINGVLVTSLKIPYFVTTLGMMQVARGAVYIITNGVPVKGIPLAYNTLGYGKVLGVPISAIIWFALAMLMFLILRFTRYGQHVYSVGGNERAAWLCGVNTKRIKISAFMLSGAFSALAGLLLTLRVMQATANAASNYELTAIASCIVGGIALEGGQGNILSSIVGAIIMGLILNLLQLLGVSSYWQVAITGTIIIGAVAADSFRARKEA